MKKIIGFFALISSQAFAWSPIGPVAQVDLSVECDSGYCETLECSVTQYSSMSAQVNQRGGETVSTSYLDCKPWAYLLSGIGGDLSILLSAGPSGECIEKVESISSSGRWNLSKQGTQWIGCLPE